MHKLFSVVFAKYWITKMCTSELELNFRKLLRFIAFCFVGSNNNKLINNE